jgi:biopolymer transport protein ExbB
MKPSSLRVTFAVLAALTALSLAQPSDAQQNAAPAPQQVSALSQPAPTEAAPASAAPIATEPATVPAASEPRPPASATAGMQELSPWSMFLAADILVKAVMIGLAFASLVTWTVGIAKTIELSLAQRGLRAGLGAIGEAKSLADAQRALGDNGDKSNVKRSALSALLAAALREARLSAGISGDAGIKERAASSCAEIVRAEARRIRIGMGVLATIGATSPFVGLFGTVWGIMNSFIGISKSQTTNLAVVAPGIAEALLATAFGLVAAIPAVIIYNHFSRVTKGYLELVSRASGAAARLLSRDLDRGHVTAHARAAE